MSRSSPSRPASERRRGLALRGRGALAGALLLLAGLTLPARAAEPADAVPDAAPPAARRTAAEPVVELYTMGQGELMFEKFGHAALCISPGGDERRGRCYNYGTTDFDSVVPLFWGFVRGRSLFWVSVSSKRRMLDHYVSSDRTLWRQVVPLEPEVARELARTLARTVKSEDRYYRYHHFHDNCSTRLRDLLDEATGGALSADPDAAAHPTYRAISRAGFAGDPAILLASDLVLGRAADRRPDAYEAMFLPDVLRAEVEARLGVAPELIYQRQGPPFPRDPGAGGRPVWLVLALLLAAPVALARWRGRRERLALAVAAVPLTLLGLLLWTLAVVSPLPEVRWNEVLLVFVPSDVVLPLLGAVARRRYATARVAILAAASLLLAVGVLRQPLWLLVPVPLGVMLLAALPPRRSGT